MNPEDELKAFEAAWNDAMTGNDVTAIGRFMADDWVIIGTDGKITGKPEFLQSISSKDVSHRRMDADYTRAKVYGETGVVTSRGTSAGKYKGADFELYEWVTSTYIRQNGNWLCVLTMVMPATK